VNNCPGYADPGFSQYLPVTVFPVKFIDGISHIFKSYMMFPATAAGTYADPSTHVQNHGHHRGTAIITQLGGNDLLIAMRAIETGNLILWDLYVAFMVIAPIDRTKPYDTPFLGNLNIQLDARKVFQAVVTVHQRLMAVRAFHIE
jgi:hypothetical protein